ncbi:MAG: hypothetical protein HYX90_06905 [Chloroflexi bacterium]|nr:hypothetical protein [Chloroflexota bacterium]
MSKRAGPIPFLYSGAIFIVSLILAFLATSREMKAIETGAFPIPPEIIGTPPEKAGPPLLYFFLLVIVLGIVLFLIPISRLRVVLRVVFGFAFSWGLFITLWLFGTPAALAGAIAAVAGLAWLFRPKIWLHNALLIATLVGMASIFGIIFSPWTALLFMFVISVYDYLSVRFGYMLWMARKLSESDTLPAFFIPSASRSWTASITGPELKKVFEQTDTGTSDAIRPGPPQPLRREFSVLGGGDIGFPLLLAVSVMFSMGIVKGIVVAGFSLLGIGAAYMVHLHFMKGRPTPALPPVFVLSFAGFLVVRYLM